jgi:hypothetical protein
MLNRFRKFQVLGLVIVGLAGFSACTHQKVHQVGTHKVTVSRHGFEKKLISDRNQGTFEYEGVSTAGKTMKVTITVDKVKVNGVSGAIRPGDSVLIGDEGVAVNDLDYGQSAKYLQANISATEATTRN